MHAVRRFINVSTYSIEIKLSFIIFWYLDEPAQMCTLKTPFIAHCATHNAAEKMMAQSVQLKHHSVSYASRRKPQRGKRPLCI